MSAVNLLVCTFIAKYPYQMAAIEVRQAYRIFNSFFYDLFYEFALFFFMFNFRNWVTQIDLPLKQSMTMSDKARSVFQNIHPSLLLFLNRLQTLIIENMV